jgi:hypothetical protein
MDDTLPIKSLIKRYIEVDTEITDINKSMKDIKDKKKEYESQIKDYLIENDIRKIDIGNGGSIGVTKSKPSKKVNKAVIVSNLLGVMDQENVDKIIAHIYEGEDDEEEVTKLQHKRARKV